VDPDEVPLTREERLAIATLQRLAKRWPKSLWLYSGSGTLNVMRMDEDGREAMRGEGVDSDYVVDEIDIRNDGGDW
jgi:hypothetical protein